MFRVAALMLFPFALAASGCDEAVEPATTDTNTDAVSEVGDSDGEDDAEVDADDDADTPDDTDRDASSDPGSVDVSEAFCRCDDECLPLGDGSVCNGTVCTFGVAGVPCTDASEDASDADADDSSDDADATDADATDADATDADADVVSTSTFAFVLDSGGGFVGRGSWDYSLTGRTFTSTYMGEPRCSGELWDEAYAALAAAIEAVDWASLDPTYVPEENPTCCCDQFGYDLSVTLDKNDAPTRYSVSWCTQSLDEALLPSELLSAIGAIESAADAVAGRYCAL